MAVITVSCDGKNRKIARIEDYMNKGEYLIALFETKQLSRESPEDADVLTLMGEIQSVEPLSASSSIDYLLKAYDQNHNFTLLEDVILILLDIGKPEDALSMLSPARLSPEKFFSDDVTLFRQGIRCVMRPISMNLDKLRSLPDHPYKTEMLFRCRIAAGLEEEGWETLLNDIRQIQIKHTQCRLWVMVPEEILKKHELLDRKSKCKREFAGDPHIYRRNFLISSEESPNTILHQYSELPPYPENLPFYPYIY